MEMFEFYLGFLTLVVLLVVTGTNPNILDDKYFYDNFLADEVAENSVQNEDEISWMLLPDDNGQVRVAILSGLEPSKRVGPEDINFLLWTRENPHKAERQIFNGSCLPKFRFFDPKKRTKVLIHGFGDTPEDSIMFPLLKDGDYNIMAVDWSKLAAAPWYNLAARNTKLAAKHTAAMIDYLIRYTGTNIGSFHLIGFSLGAHVVGITGQYVKSGRIKRITGLDPAQVLFTSAPDDQKLDDTDADLVEVVHTSGGYLAFLEPIGHRDFFPNGGSWPQPGCVLDFVAVCSHRRAYYYYAEAVMRQSGFVSTPCTDYYTYKSDKCQNESFTITMYNDFDNSVRGKFFLTTNSEAPFSVE